MYYLAFLAIGYVKGKRFIRKAVRGDMDGELIEHRRRKGSAGAEAFMSWNELKANDRSDGMNEKKKRGIRGHPAEGLGIQP